MVVYHPAMEVILYAFLACAVDEICSRSSPIEVVFVYILTRRQQIGK
jgi:hypothetical protein